jgi:hypothetical protein
MDYCESLNSKLPVGHRVSDKGKLAAFPWGEAADLPASCGPTGLAHMSVKDFAIWAGWNVGEDKRGPALVKPETLSHSQPVVRMAATHPNPC